jgi:hypothetical protein
MVRALRDRCLRNKSEIKKSLNLNNDYREILPAVVRLSKE